MEQQSVEQHVGFDGAVKTEQEVFEEMMVVRDARKHGLVPADATDEEIITVYNARKAGYNNSVELLRENRAKALPELDRVEQRAREQARKG